MFDLRFPGQRYDAASALHYNYFRDYEPGTGRYSQSDPIGLAGGMSTYGYTDANPDRFIDPLSLFRKQQGIASGFGMLGDGAGVVVGMAMIAVPGAQILGAAILFKSLWGLTANTYNFARSFSDDASYDLPSKYNSPTRALASWFAPCNEAAQRIADIADLSLDFAAGRAIFKAANYGGYLKIPRGYPYTNTNPVIIRTTDTLVMETLSKRLRIFVDAMQFSDASFYLYDAYPGMSP